MCYYAHSSTCFQHHAWPARPPQLGTTAWSVQHLPSSVSAPGEFLQRLQTVCGTSRAHGLSVSSVDLNPSMDFLKVSTVYVKSWVKGINTGPLDVENILHESRWRLIFASVEYLVSNVHSSSLSAAAWQSWLEHWDGRGAPRNRR